MYLPAPEPAPIAPPLTVLLVPQLPNTKAALKNNAKNLIFFILVDFTCFV
jgi:hypothetical protein